MTTKMNNKISDSLHSTISNIQMALHFTTLPTPCTGYSKRKEKQQQKS